MKVLLQNGVEVNLDGFLGELVEEIAQIQAVCDFTEPQPGEFQVQPGEVIISEEMTRTEKAFFTWAERRSEKEKELIYKFKNGGDRKTILEELNALRAIYNAGVRLFWISIEKRCNTLTDPKVCVGIRHGFKVVKFPRKESDSSGMTIIEISGPHSFMDFLAGAHAHPKHDA